ncbi:MAG: ATP-dependent DNA helicase [Verrucomicrobiota bacterium]
MQIDPIARKVRLSVGELAGLRNSPRNERSGGYAWRAKVGQDWHRTLETETANQYPGAIFEVPIQASWQREGWTLEIQGRMDQVLPEGDATLKIREVKTIREPLPIDDVALEASYPEYFAQVATYETLASVLPEYQGKSIQAELVFVDIDSGMLQTVEIGEEGKQLFDSQLELLLTFLNERRNARIKFDSAEIKPAFETLREGQAELFETLATEALKAKTVLLEAPTGFGKTGIVLEHALRQMQNGIYERCIYLTSKSTGQLQTIAQLRGMIGDGLRYIQMRNRAEHYIESAAHTCTGNTDCERELGQRWREQNLRVTDLFEAETLSLERAKAIGESTGLCPYALTKACLPFAEVWIGDSNYIFSPASQSVFADPYGFDPARTLLIIDEAHNLPERVASALSIELDATDLIFATEAIATAGAPRKLSASLNELIRAIESLPTGQALAANRYYELLDLSEDIAGQLIEARLDYDALPGGILDTIWQIPELEKRLNEPAHEWLHWSPKTGQFRASCLDPSRWTAQCLRPFGGSMLMSATLHPLSQFQESCGLKKSETIVAQGHADWRERAYEVAIDCRVDTRLKQREKYYEMTARTVSHIATQQPGEPIAVFFASYQYAANIQAYLSALDPSLRTRVQPRGVDLDTQKQFIEESLLTSDALFLILGSSYAEGIDTLGGRVETAMIVGPALPEVNAIQDAKMQAHPSLNREDSFRDVYILPAMRRIHQALGRLVRAPGQRARILLHDKRFAMEPYRSQLAAEYQTDNEITNDTQLDDWLRSSRD